MFYLYIILGAGERIGPSAGLSTAAPGVGPQ